MYVYSPALHCQNNRYTLHFCYYSPLHMVAKYYVMNISLTINLNINSGSLIGF